VHGPLLKVSWVPVASTYGIIMTCMLRVGIHWRRSLTSTVWYAHCLYYRDTHRDNCHWQSLLEASQDSTEVLGYVRRFCGPELTLDSYDPGYVNIPALAVFAAGQLLHSIIRVGGRPGPEDPSYPPSLNVIMRRMRDPKPDQRLTLDEVRVLLAHSSPVEPPAPGPNATFASGHEPRAQCSSGCASGFGQERLAVPSRASASATTDNIMEGQGHGGHRDVAGAAGWNRTALPVATTDDTTAEEMGCPLRVELMVQESLGGLSPAGMATSGDPVAAGATGSHGATGTGSGPGSTCGLTLAGPSPATQAGTTGNTFGAQVTTSSLATSVQVASHSGSNACTTSSSSAAGSASEYVLVD
jgi:hypothetical protein